MNFQKDKPVILIVDDIPENIDVLKGILKKNYRTKAAVDGYTALKIANSSYKPDLILLDVMMPEIDGYEVCKKLKEKPNTKNIPIIFVTAKNETEDEAKGLELGAADYLTKPVNSAIVKARIQTHLALYDQNRHLEQKVEERTKELKKTRLEIIQRLGRAAEYKDNETGLHVIRMSHYSRVIAEKLDYGKDWSELIFQAAPMHDIGKIGVPDKILLKPGKLDAEEWNIMRKHPLFGYEIIGKHESELLKLSREVAISHHEKWNGSGYPYGKKEIDIPLSGRIIAIADVFDALTSERPYKKAWTVEKALEVINNDSGIHFDPELVRIFNKSLDEILAIKEMYNET